MICLDSKKARDIFKNTGIGISGFYLKIPRIWISRNWDFSVRRDILTICYPLFRAHSIYKINSIYFELNMSISGDELPAFSPLCWCLGGRGAFAVIWLCFQNSWSRPVPESHFLFIPIHNLGFLNWALWDAVKFKGPINISILVFSSSPELFRSP